MYVILFITLSSFRPFFFSIPQESCGTIKDDQLNRAQFTFFLLFFFFPYLIQVSVSIYIRKRRYNKTIRRRRKEIKKTGTEKFLIKKCPITRRTWTGKHCLDLFLPFWPFLYSMIHFFRFSVPHTPKQIWKTVNRICCNMQNNWKICTKISIITYYYFYE